MKVKFVGFGGYFETPCYEDENGRLYFDEDNGYNELSLYTGAYKDECGEICGEPYKAVKEPVECDQPFKRNPREFDYMLLGRLRMDCNYYVSRGGCSNNSLWADIDTILEKMESILKSFSASEKPEWLTEDEFEELKNRVKETQRDYEKRKNAR